MKIFFCFVFYSYTLPKHSFFFQIQKQGDSGGPLILKKGNRAIQIGIVSFSIPCAVPGYPDVFTRVSKYIDWISKNTGINFRE